MNRRKILMTVGLAALSVASAEAATASHPPPVGDDTVIIVDQAGEAAVAEALEDPRNPVIARPHGRWAIGVAIGTLIAGLVSLIGFGGVVQALGDLASGAVRLASASVKAPAKAARSAARHAGKALKTSSRWLWGSGAVGALLFIAALALDWPLKVGIGAGLVGAFASLSLAKRLRRRQFTNPASAA
ncbi:MAG: hypothetical protein ACWA5T_11670 [Parvularcula sp.]